MGIIILCVTHMIQNVTRQVPRRIYIYILSTYGLPFPEILDMISKTTEVYECVYEEYSTTKALKPYEYIYVYLMRK